MSELTARLLGALGAEALARPLWLVPLLAAAAVALGCAARARPPTFPWPGVLEARVAGARRRDPVRIGALLLRAAATAALALVLAGPVAVHRAPPQPGLGLDLVLAVDASESMRALDARVGGEWRTRLALAREVVARFAAERVAEGDRVALVVFGEDAFTQMPLSSDGALLASALARVEAGVAGRATVLGDALALSVKRALGAGGDADRSAGRVVVLLTDGRSNAGAVPVDVAARLAASEGIRVHTVGIGTAGEEVPMARDAGEAGRGLRFERHDVDAATLERIAAATGGRFFAARRSSDLAAVYREIDALERVARPGSPRVRRDDRPEPLLAAAGGLLLLEIAWARVLRRRIP